MENHKQNIYSDGPVESRILAYLQTHHNDSKGIISAMPEGAVFHNFTQARENLLRWYPFEKNCRVLEIGAGMGALTPYIASTCGSVVALEPSADRAQIISARCSNVDNVQVVQGTLDEYCKTPEKFDYVLVLGVLEYAGIGSTESNPWRKMLSDVKKLLKADGKILLAIENKFGLKYWCGASEDHTGIAFDSINDYVLSRGATGRYSGTTGVRTFSKVELEELLRQVGLPSQKFFYLLPDYKFPSLILTDKSVCSEDLVSDVKLAYPDESVLIANEAKLLPQMAQNGVLDFFANSFLVEAGMEHTVHSGVETVTIKRDYKEQYRLINIIEKDYVLRFPTGKESEKHIQQIQKNTQELMARGIPCLANVETGNGGIKTERVSFPRGDRALITALESGNYALAFAIIDRLKQYLQKSGEVTLVGGELVLEEGYPDLTLRNSFWVNEDLLFFDQEWKTENVPLKYLLYRSLEYSLREVSHETGEAVFGHCGITAQDREKYAEQERQFLSSLMDEENCKWFDRLMYRKELELKSIIERELDNQQGHIEQLLESERNLKQRNSVLESQIAQVKQNMARLSQEKETIWGEVLQLREKENQHLNELSSLRQEKENTWGEVLQLRDKENRYLNELSSLRQEKENTWGEVLQLRDKENRYLNEIAAIKASRSWRVGRFFARFVRFFVPVGSKRAVFLRLLVTMIKHPGKFFSCLTPKKAKKFFRLLRRGDLQSIQDLIRMNITGQWAPPALEAVLPEVSPIAPVEEVVQKTAQDYPVLNVPQWENPQVSIVIPVYNQFEFTYHCVESIVKNSGDITYEILIGNDCSTDLTTQIEQIIPGVKCITNEKNLRFVLNCKNAAKYAKGTYLLFLNNDTQVQPNWLEPLVTLIESADDIGMVGSKLVYPDGTLQEAGGILWRDGSAWNYGNRQNPALPEFNYVKEVDYISGAAIMLPRALWEEIGGFDERFVPAYCDDSDLAFTVRKKGYRVMYQPQSVVVHFEGVSNGTDTSSGQKQYQIINSQKFYEKWKDVLEAEHFENGQNVFQARDRSRNRKTLLVVDHYVPHYDKDAGSRTVFQYLKLFVKLGFNVKFIGDNFYQHEPYTTTLQQMGIEVLYGPDYAAHWERWIRENAEQFDYAFLNRPHIAPRYLEVLRKYTKAKIVYYGHDLGFLREMREYEVTGDEKFKESSLEWQPKELAIMRKADMAYYPSYVEVEAIHAIDPSISVKAIPAYLFEDVSWKGYNFQERKDIMFIGGFSHRPNVDAVKWLAAEILPELVKQLPEIRIHILGSNAPDEIKNLENEHLRIEGFVTDEELGQYYRNCRISLVPLRYGAGIKGKVIEAMRFGTPVVTTSTGAEGIPDAESVMVVEDDAVSLAGKIAELYQDADALTAMSQNGVRYIQEHYTPKNALAVIAPEFDLQCEDFDV